MNKIILLTKPSASPKTIKSLNYGYANFIMYLAPHLLSGFNTCANATIGCIKGCLNKAGRGAFKQTQKARIKRTKFFFQDRLNFIDQLNNEIERAINWSIKKVLTPVFRLNGTSDIRFELYDIFENFQDVQFYDYTKIINRKNLPSNYHLTFSRAESNQENVLKAIELGLNVAVVFTNGLPGYYLNRPVINGDLHDLRFLDQKNVIVGLKAKGPAKKDKSGFVLDTNELNFLKVAA